MDGFVAVGGITYIRLLHFGAGSGSARTERNGNSGNRDVGEILTY